MQTEFDATIVFWTVVAKIHSNVEFYFVICSAIF